MLPASSKARGFLAELILGVEAQKRGLVVLTPGGDNEIFDLVILNGCGRFIKVQVKSCLQKEPGRDRHNFTCKKGGKKQQRTYNKQDIDILALYAFDTEVWHFVPVEVIGTDSQVKIDNGGKYDIFRDNWDIFK